MWPQCIIVSFPLRLILNDVIPATRPSCLCSCYSAVKLYKALMLFTRCHFVLLSEYRLHLRVVAILTTLFVFPWNYSTIYNLDSIVYTGTYIHLSYVILHCLEIAVKLSVKVDLVMLSWEIV